MRGLSLVLFTFLFSASSFAAGWTNWESLGGYLTSDPAACSVGGFTYVFVRGGDNGLYYRERRESTGVWGPWKNLGNKLQGAPAVACSQFSDGRMRNDIFFTATTPATGTVVWHMWGTVNGPWNAESLGGNPLAGSGPAAVSTGRGRFDLFIRGNENQLWHRAFRNGSWSAWEPLYNQLTSDPAASFWPTGRIDVFARGFDNTLHYRPWDGRWFDWVLLPGEITSAPDAVSLRTGHYSVFARGAGDALYQRTYASGAWSPWVNLGGTLTSGPAATTYALGTRIMVFVRGSDGALWYRAWAP
jgi:hypothetical protein